MGSDVTIFVFWMLSFRPTFSFSSFTFIKRLFSSSSLSAIGWCHLHIWSYWYFSGNLDSSLCFIQPSISGASLVAHMWTQETWVQPLGQEDPLEEETASHSSILVWEIPRTEEPDGLQSMRSQRSQTRLKRLSSSSSLLENSRPLSPVSEPQTPLSSLGTQDFLSACLGIDSLTS